MHHNKYIFLLLNFFISQKNIKKIPIIIKLKLITLLIGIPIVIISNRKNNDLI